MAHHAITMADGSIAIMQTVDELCPDGLSADEFAAQCIAKWPNAASVMATTQIDPKTIPQDRTFRDAWVVRGGIIEHDIDKARAIQRARVGAVAPPKPQIDPVAAVAIDAAQTVEDLKVAGLPK